MKIALCTEILYPLYGVERRVYEMANRFKKFNIDVDLYTSTPSNVFPQLNIKQISPPTIINPPKRNYTFCLRYWKNLFVNLCKKKYDIIDANGHLPLIPSSLACKIKKTPIVGTIHDLYLNKWSGLYSLPGVLFGLPIEIMMTKMPYTKIVTINSAISKKIEKVFKVNKNKIKMIPSGIDIKEIDSIVERTKDGTIIYVGRLVPQKNIDILIKAISKLNGTCLKIIGEGEEETKLRLLAKELGIEKRIIFFGKLKNHEDIIREIKKSSILVLPSLKENFGIVPLEAMACGTPVISTRTEGPRDYIVNGENGFLTEIGDEDDLAKSIENLLENVQTSRKFILNGRKTAEEYDWDKIIKQIINLYNQIV